MYEMVAGYPPFYDEDRVAMFRNICQVKYTVPSHFSKVRHHTRQNPASHIWVPAAYRSGSYVTHLPFLSGSSVSF